MSEPGAGSDRHGGVRSSQNLVAGLGLVGLGLFGVWAGSDLTRGTLGAIGPGLMPFWLSVGVAACGAALAVAGLLRGGEGLQGLPLRGPVVVTLAILAFAVTIRPVAIGSFTTPGLGLVVAGPLAVLVAGYASHEARFADLLALGLLLTAGCMLLFGDMLNLPIPMFPTALIQAVTGSISTRTLLRLVAGALAVAGLATVFLTRRSARRQPIDVAQHSLTT